MAKDKKQAQGLDETVEDFSKRYPGGESIEAPTGEWFAFEDVGDELVGEWSGMEPFRNGVKGSILTKDGLTVFSVAKLLQQQLKQIRQGERIAIVLAGFKKSDKQSPMKVYQVFRVRR